MDTAIVSNSQAIVMGGLGVRADLAVTVYCTETAGVTVGPMVGGKVEGEGLWEG